MIRAVVYNKHRSPIERGNHVFAARGETTVDVDEVDDLEVISSHPSLEVRETTEVDDPKPEAGKSGGTTKGQDKDEGPSATAAAGATTERDADLDQPPPKPEAGKSGSGDSGGKPKGGSKSETEKPKSGGS